MDTASLNISSSIGISTGMIASITGFARNILSKLNLDKNEYIPANRNTFDLCMYPMHKIASASNWEPVLVTRLNLGPKSFGRKCYSKELIVSVNNILHLLSKACVASHPSTNTIMLSRHASKRRSITGTSFPPACYSNTAEQPSHIIAKCAPVARMQCNWQSLSNPWGWVHESCFRSLAGGAAMVQCSGTSELDAKAGYLNARAVDIA